MKEDQKYGLEIKESGEVEHCVKFGPIYNPFKVSSYFNYSGFERGMGNAALE